MLENYLELYIDNLMANQNKSAEKIQQNLYSRKEYYELLKPVIELLKKHKDYSLEEMRNVLFVNSGIEQKVKDFIYKKEIVPGMVFSYGTDKYRETVVVGNRQEVSLDKNGNLVPNIEQMTDDTIFDLASVTKLFTSLSILKLVQNGIISLDDKITKYDPRFKHLNNISIFDLISFRVPLKTNSRVDNVLTKDEAEKILFDIEVNKESDNTNPYTDMGSMVLKYIIESASGMSYYKFIDEFIINSLGLIDTYSNVPIYKRYRVASTNFETQIMKQNIIYYDDISKGVVNDSKARLLSGDNNVAGHAGLFSTATDMTKLAKGIISGKIIDDKYVEMMAKNRTGRKYLQDGKDKYVQYLGFLCYSKHPIISSSEVFHAMSGRTFASAGWTGSQFTVDPINQIYLFASGNRTHNRISRNLNLEFKSKLIEDGDGKKMILLPNGDIKIDSTRYAWDRDSVIVHPTLKLSIQYKMLEDIYELYNEKIEHTEKIKTI